MTANASVFESVTYSDFSSGLSMSAVGCDPGAVTSLGANREIQRTTRPEIRSSSATLDAFHRLHQARLASRLATTVYGNEVGTTSLVLTSNRRRILPVCESRRTTVSERL